MHWNEGYRAEITYTHGYYGEMNPVAMRFLFLASGIVPPDVTTACELGYGQGLSLNIHAATEPVVWYGADFNPAQALFAQQLAHVSGAHCYGDSFQELLKKRQLPELDYIALHGIWSWIAPTVQRDILTLIDTHLKPGGVAYISYNAYPGWAAFKPLRDLMKLHMDSGAHGDSGSKAQAAFAFAHQLLELNPAYAIRNPEVKKRVEDFRAKAPAYLVHEFFNDTWQLNSFADMAAQLEDVRLSFACSAQPVLTIGGVGLSQEQREFLAAIPDPVLRETVLDFLRNTQFRKDYWVKGRRPLPPSRRMAALREQSLILLTPASALEQEVKVESGSVRLTDATYAIFTGVLGDGKPHTLGELEKAAQTLAARRDAPEGADKENLNNLTQTAVLLMGAQILAPAQAKAESMRQKPKTEKLNALLETMAVDDGAISFLGSPVTGGGIGVGRFEQLLIYAYGRGARTSEAMGSFACDALLSVGQRMVEDGATLEPPAMLARLQEIAAAFIVNRLPLLKNLQVV